MLGHIRLGDLQRGGQRIGHHRLGTKGGTDQRGDRSRIVGPHRAQPDQVIDLRHQRTVARTPVDAYVGAMSETPAFLDGDRPADGGALILSHQEQRQVGERVQRIIDRCTASRCSTSAPAPRARCRGYLEPYRLVRGLAGPAIQCLEQRRSEDAILQHGQLLGALAASGGAVDDHAGSPVRPTRSEKLARPCRAADRGSSVPR